MKIWLVAFSFLSSFSVSTFACEVFDTLGAQQGQVKAGVIYDRENAIAGWFMSGQVTDANRTVVGTVKNGAIFATDQYVLGRVVSGAVYDPNGALLMNGNNCTSGELGAAALIFALN